MKWNKKNISSQEIIEGRALASLSYVWIIGPIIAYFKNKQLNNSFVSYSISQQLVLYVLAFFSYYFLEVFYMNLLIIVGLALVLFWGYGLINVSKGRVVNIFGFIDKQGNRRRLRYFPVLGLLALPLSFIFYDEDFFSRSFGFDYYIYNLDQVMIDYDKDAMHIIITVIVLSIIGFIIDNTRIDKLVKNQIVTPSKDYQVEIAASQKVDNSESSTHSN